MALFPYADGDDPDASDQLTCASVPPKGYNKSRICDPQIDALLTAGVATSDEGRVGKASTRTSSVAPTRRLPLVFTYQPTIVAGAAFRALRRKRVRVLDLVDVRHVAPRRDALRLQVLRFSQSERL